MTEEEERRGDVDAILVMLGDYEGPPLPEKPARPVSLLGRLFSKMPGVFMRK